MGLGLALLGLLLHPDDPRRSHLRGDRVLPRLVQDWCPIPALLPIFII